MQLSRDRLREAYGIIRDGLEDIGVPVKKAQAGIFVFADFSEYLDRQEYEREQVFWEKVYNELMINISPGHLFGSSKPGWFRACYAIDKESVEEACSRLAKLKK
jgi:aspartate/methionine/tyrosine aminotransferase